jgi:hypothetical protein
MYMLITGRGYMRIILSSALSSTCRRGLSGFGHNKVRERGGGGKEREIVIAIDTGPGEKGPRARSLADASVRGRRRFV